MGVRGMAVGHVWSVDSFRSVEFLVYCSPGQWYERQRNNCCHGAVRPVWKVDTYRGAYTLHTEGPVDYQQFWMQ
eukprot:1162014-Pelagomonas_calceolata.AAC.9